MSFALVIIGLIVIIMVHEAGHFLAARAVGIRATRFFLFFPPTLASVKRGEVEYGIGWIPLGGFVKLPGMFEPRGRESWWRIEALTDDLLLGVADDDLRLRINDATHGLERAHTADRVSHHCEVLRTLVAEAVAARGDDAPELENGMPATAWQRRMRRLDDRLAGIIDDAHPRAYWRADLWRRMVVIAAGPLINVVLAFVVLFAAVGLREPVTRYDWKVGLVVKDSPAQQAGIRAGDSIVSWNGHRYGTNVDGAKAFLGVVRDSAGKPIDVVVRRDGKTITRHIDPRPITYPGEKQKLTRVGMQPGAVASVDHYRRNGPVRAARVAANMTWLNTKFTVTSIRDRFEQRNLKDVHTVVGIVQLAPEVNKDGYLPHYIATISLVIAIMNLLPILPLDGGHLLFGFLEFVRRGRPVPRMVFERASVVGLVLMLTIFWAGLRNDLGIH